MNLYVYMFWKSWKSFELSPIYWTGKELYYRHDNDDFPGGHAYAY